MNEADEFELRRDQWERLKALRTRSAASSGPKHRLAIDDLVALGLVAIEDQLPAITPKGRKALIRGSFRLWDVVA